MPLAWQISVLLQPHFGLHFISRKRSLGAANTQEVLINTKQYMFQQQGGRIEGNCSCLKQNLSSVFKALKFDEDFILLRAKLVESKEMQVLHLDL